MLIDHLDVGCLINYVESSARIDIQIVSSDDYLDIRLTLRVAVNIDFDVILSEALVDSHVLEVDLVLQLVIKIS